MVWKNRDFSQENETAHPFVIFDFTYLEMRENIISHYEHSKLI